MYKNNTIENDAILISDQRIHLTTLVTNDENESIIVLDKDNIRINGDCDIKGGTIRIDDVDLLDYITSNTNTSYYNKIQIINDDNNSPGFTWSNNPTSGMYQSLPGEVDFAINTEKKFEINKNGVHILGNMINNRQFEKAVINGIFIDNENNLSIGSNVETKFLYINDENSFLIEDLMIVDDLVINPDESSLFVNSGSEKYYDFSILNCSSNGEYKSNTNINDVILITGNSNQRLHLSTSDTNEQNESLVILENDNLLINGNCYIKGTLSVNNKTLFEFTENVNSNNNSNNSNNSTSILSTSVRIPIDDLENPGYSWSNNIYTGMYQSKIGQIDFGINKEQKLAITNTGVQIFGDCEIYGKIIENAGNSNNTNTNNTTYNNFDKLVANSIFIKTIKNTIFGANIISNGIFIGYGDTIGDNAINTQFLHIDLNETATFQLEVISADNISEGILSIKNGGTGSSIATGSGIPVLHNNPIFSENIVVQKSIITSDVNNTIPNGNKTQLTNALDIIDNLTPFLYETENIIKSGLDSNIPTSLEHILSDNGKLINYIQLIPYLIQAVKELKSMIP